MNTRYEVYKLLRECNCSGDEIGITLSITRASVNKHIMALRSIGVIIDAKSGSGYKYVRNDSVNEYALAYELEKIGVKCDSICTVADSTSNIAKEYAVSSSGDRLFVSPYQLGGRGRKDRVFNSEIGGMYMSLVLDKVELPLGEVMRMVIATGIAVYNSMNEYGIKTELKWPNDVYVAGKKICGILLELISDGEYANKLIIGVGINTNNKLPAELKSIATTLYKETGLHYDIAKLASVVVNNIYKELSQLKNNGWLDMKKRYEDVSYTIGKSIKYNQVSGMATGITDQGFLIVDNHKIITAGDVEIC